MTKSNDQTAVIEAVVTEFVEERLNHLEQWGVQDYPSSFGAGECRQFATLADRWKAINDARQAEGTTTWSGILAEEVYEACAEIDPLLRRAELVQVGAVAAAEIEAIDRAIANGAYDCGEPVAEKTPAIDDGQAA